MPIRPQSRIVNPTKGIIYVENIEGETQKDQLNRFEEVLVSDPCYIIVECRSLSQQVRKRIAVGNFLHKASTISGLVTVALSLVTKIEPFSIILIARAAFSALTIGAAVLYQALPFYNSYFNYQLVGSTELVAKVTDRSPDSCSFRQVYIRKNDIFRVRLQQILAFSALYSLIKGPFM
ncbi:Transmembrane protein 11, mitochondrial [Thelohanellus kitauei]|uniref:Transmembrane protein 11, mitochondrial n=1 Tax=Thelohanellus kitauei TaxID=669202 RepID=A0A0C2NHT7_THEKT|nr:Transmembrane protein 11, mitochondrial [Thelohanellus kitauei]